MLKSIIFLDTYYPPVLKDTYGSSYRERLNYLLNKSFGTADYYSQAFQSYGWQAVDIIGNDTQGQALYMKERNYAYSGCVDAVKRQLIDLQPDILYCQDLSFLSPTDIKFLRNYAGIKLIVAQHGCPWAGDDRIKAFDTVFTSFPHYIARIAELAVEAFFLQIGYGGPTLEEKLVKSNPSAFKPYSDRALDCVFVGGIGPDKQGGHWTQGTQLLHKVADMVSGFKWWGYGQHFASGSLARTYQGEAWGSEMYEIYGNSKIVINRHGEVAEGYSNNCRMFEATGSGALLMTENSKNITDYFDPGECVIYDSADDLIEKIGYYLVHDDERQAIAKAGREKTLRSHTYSRILRPVADLLLDKLSE